MGYQGYYSIPRAKKVYGHMSDEGVKDVSEMYNEQEDGLEPREMRMSSRERQYLKEQGIMRYEKRKRRWMLTALGIGFVGALIFAGVLLYRKQSNTTQINPTPRTSLPPRTQPGMTPDTTQPEPDVPPETPPIVPDIPRIWGTEETQPTYQRPTLHRQLEVDPELRAEIEDLPEASLVRKRYEDWERIAQNRDIEGYDPSEVGSGGFYDFANPVGTKSSGGFFDLRSEEGGDIGSGGFYDLQPEEKTVQSEGGFFDLQPEKKTVKSSGGFFDLQPEAQPKEESTNRNQNILYWLRAVPPSKRRRSRK